MDSANPDNGSFGGRLPPGAAPLVFVVAEDVKVHASLEQSICCAGLYHRVFKSARGFLAEPRPVVPSCLVFAFSSQSQTDLEMQRRIANERPEMPIIVISSGGNILTAVQAMKAGAFDLLVQPFSDNDLLDAIQQGFERGRAALDREMQNRDARNRFASLSSREREVMALVVSGLMNKEVGAELGISIITVKAHRGKLMRKMGADSLASLVCMAGSLGLSRATIHFRCRTGWPRLPHEPLPIGPATW